MKSLVIGGNGALGRSVTRMFKQTGWKVISMDVDVCKYSDSNIIVDARKTIREQAANLVAQTDKYKFNSIICVAGGFQMGSIAHDNLFEDYERMDALNFQPALLAGHIATKSLSEQGMLLFTGAATVFDGPV
jgi:NAD(P)-dependent dehydrogenase (short-subunit alcohol dehydrogenase family)